VGEQMQEALQTNGELVIPLGEFAAHIPGTGLEKSLLDHIRTNPESMTRAEAQTFMQAGHAELNKEAQQILEQKDFDGAFKESAASVENELLAQLKQANRFSDSVNGAYAKLASAFYAVQAARLGITPEEMYVKYPLQVTAQGLSNTHQMDQTSSNFQNWFKNSQVKDESGKPLVVYHGTTGDFNAFNPMHAGSNTLAFSGKAGFWFTSSDKHASDFASEKAGGNVMPVYLSMQNPLVVSNVNDEKGRMAAIDQAKKEKRDGVIFKNSEDTSKVNTRNTSDLYLAFNPEQVKSAVGNNGNFDPNTPNVLHQEKQAGITVAAARGLANTSIPYGGRAGDRRAMDKQKRNIIEGLVKAGLKERDAKSIVDDALTRQASANRGGPMMFIQSHPLLQALQARGLLLEEPPPTEAKPLEQSARGQITFGDDITQSPSTITLLQNADLSTFVHELGHFQLEVLTHIASQPDAPGRDRRGHDALLKWFNVPGSDEPGAADELAVAERSKTSGRCTSSSRADSKPTCSKATHRTVELQRHLLAHARVDDQRL
jgi:hypothetical protein